MKKIVELSMLLVFGFTVAALGGCAGLSAGFQQGYQKSYDSTHIALGIGPIAEKAMTKAKENVRTVNYVQPDLQKECSVQVSSGADLPDLTTEKLQAVEEMVVNYLKKNGWVVRSGTSLVLNIKITKYREGTLKVARMAEGAVTLGAAKSVSTEMGGDLSLIKDGSQVLLDTPIPTTSTESNIWNLKLENAMSVKDLQEVFSQTIVLILNDYLGGKLVKKVNS